MILRRRRWAFGLALVGLLSQAIPNLHADDAALARALEARTQATIRSTGHAIVALLRKRTATTSPVQGEFGEQARPEQPLFVEAVATGVLVSQENQPESRYVLTTCRAVLSIVEDPTRLREARIDVRLHGKRDAHATVIAADSRCDLAVLKLAEGIPSADTSKLPSLPLADAASAAKGSFVIALGNPASLARDGAAEAAFGTLSGITPFEWNGRQPIEIDRDLTPADLSSLWHVSTTVTGGSEGGAIVDLDGRLLAVTTGRVSLEDQRAAATFGMPVDRGITPLLRGEELQLGFLGLEAKSEEDRARLVRVAPGSPADEAGLQPGDVITLWGDEPITDAWKLHRRMWRTMPGDLVRVTVRRGDGDAVRERKIDLTAIRWPVRASEIVFSTAPGRQWRGMTFDAATARLSSLKDGLFGRLPAGVLVRAVDPGSPTAIMRPGQVISAVNGEDVANVNEFVTAAPATGPVRLRLSHGETVTIP
ncbi:Periplasmic pH-dependent serine endoprotease DegQ precursor [Caulifigura coniformis]|uniref:Periplasmic pH-dependent serine endoprotease DegQ n=1 Tax=Caulifigura coniformis TaxID=2527983 RepID=A0A517SJE7_9PLAN|nr:trypsin-like peptidase domain-containing protein [Caulifigura coniformis]QDT56250.1 Periplasmic pH-dependent serine endoprotease DegQ precursor [Caulifigura coniformis]